jgi:hypothetical protein
VLRNPDIHRPSTVSTMEKRCRQEAMDREFVFKPASNLTEDEAPGFYGSFLEGVRAILREETPSAPDEPI